MITIATDTAKIRNLQTKFQKYGPYAIREGLKAMTSHLNQPAFKQSMYPPSQAGQPFQWSSERQRRFVMANVDLPYSRTQGLANAGQFKVDEGRFWVEYTNSLPWWIYVLHPSHVIIGHRMRGWKGVNTFVVAQSSKLVPVFKKAALDAWHTQEAFLFGGGAGL